MIEQAGLTGVAIEGRGLVLSGPSGCGKSSLALALIDRGAVLIGDDGLALVDRDNRLWAHPPERIAGLLEIRNVGLVEMPTTHAALSLILRLTPDAPRFTDMAEPFELAGHTIPSIAFRPGDAVQALRAEHALRRYGLPDTDLDTD